jgi:hypothetical protein
MNLDIFKRGEAFRIYNGESVHLPLIETLSLRYDIIYIKMWHKWRVKKYNSQL